MSTGIITWIERQKKSAHRYNIHIDGSYRLAVHEDVLVKYALSKGMKIDPDELAEVLEAEERNKVQQAALRYIGYKPRTIREVERYLDGKGFSSYHRDDVVREMKQQGYLDDRQFALQWIAERRGGKGFGKKMLQQELARKGVSADLVEAALEKVGEEEERELAQQVADKRYHRLRHEPWPKVQRRLGQYLLRRGFPSSTVYDILRNYQKRHREEESEWE